MTVAEILVGVSLVIATAATFMGAVFAAIAEHPNGLGLWLALSEAVVGCYAVKSVWRDRL